MIAPAVVVGIAVLLLVQVQSAYFERLRTLNSQSENAFMTGEREPKEYAFKWILEHRDSARTTRILAEDWWTYWAFKYQSLGHAGFEVGLASGRWDRRFPRDAQLEEVPRQRTETFYVGYVGGPLGAWFRENQSGLGRVVVEGYGTAPILEIHVEGTLAQRP